MKFQDILNSKLFENEMLSESITYSKVKKDIKDWANDPNNKQSGESPSDVEDELEDMVAYHIGMVGDKQWEDKDLSRYFKSAKKSQLYTISLKSTQDNGYLNDFMRDCYGAEEVASDKMNGRVVVLFDNKRNVTVKESIDAAGISDNDLDMGSGVRVDDGPNIHDSDDEDDDSVPENVIYNVLFEAEGVNADRYLNTIQSMGPDICLTNILNSDLIEDADDENASDVAPWDDDDNVYQDGDIVLWWDVANHYVGVAQIDDSDVGSDDIDVADYDLSHYSQDEM